jgi:hypothetical protein
MSDTQPDNFVPTPPTATDTPPAHVPPVTATTPGTAPSTSGMAIAGLVCAFLAPLLGLIFSIIGLNQTKDNKRGGRGLAIAGLIISILGMLAGLFWIVIFILAAASTPDTGDYNFNSNSSSLSSQEATVKSGKVAEAVEAENIELTVQEVKRGYVPESDFYTPEEGKEYISVRVSLKNVGVDTQSFSSFDFKMRDGTGTEKNDAFVGGVTGELSSGSLAADGTTTGLLVFEVPTGDTNLTLVYEPSIFADEKVEIQL